MSSIQVGSVTITEILKQLEACNDNLEAPVIYGKIINLHKQKLGNQTYTAILNDLSETRALLVMANQQQEIPCEWIYHLYDAVIAMAVIAGCLKNKNLPPKLDSGPNIDKLEDKERDEMVANLKLVLSESWNKMLATM